jgi:hypothetical protein
MSTAKFFILSVLFFMFLVKQGFSQTNLQRTITDNGAEYLGNGAEPVIGTLVTVTDPADTSHTFSTKTNEQGLYSIKRTIPDRH